jgi:hypothetical protein
MKKFTAEPMRLLCIAFYTIFATMTAYAVNYGKDSQTGLWFALYDDNTCAVAPAQSGSYSMTDVTIPSTFTYEGNTYTVTTIESEAFMSTQITSVTIPEGVTSIGVMAFNNCSDLTYVSFPSTVTSVDKYAFNGCYNLTALYITDLTAWNKIEFPLTNSNPLYYAKNLYLNGELVTDLVIPEGITSISQLSFTGGKFNSITIPEGVTTIGSSAFSGCTVTSISLPSSLTTIESNAFSYTPIESITLNEGLTTIEAIAFFNCPNLKSITLPNSVTTLGNSVFKLCTSLASVTLSSGLTAISDYLFYGCSSLTGTLTDEFTEGTDLNVLIIPNNITSIGTYAFYGCSALENVWFGSGLQSIASGAFAYDNNITTVSPTSTTAPALAADAFSNTTYENAQLFIPVKESDPNYEDVSASYESDNNNWVKFQKGVTTNINEIEADNISILISGRSIDVCGNEGEIAVYDLTGTLVYKGSNNRIELSNSGIYAVIINNKCYKIAVR